MNVKTPTQAVVKIISIWSKISGLEGRLMGRNHNYEYEVTVTAAADVEDTLEAAFCATNADDRPNGNRVCSTTAGDIMVLDGQHYLVEPHGYREITEAESAQIQTLTSSDTSFGYDFMANRGLIVRTPVQIPNLNIDIV